MTISKRSLLRGFFVKRAWLTSALCLSLLTTSHPAHAHDDTPEKPVASQPDDGTSDEHQDSRDASSDGNPDAKSNSVPSENRHEGVSLGVQRQVSRVKHLLMKTGVSDEIIEQILPELEQALKENLDGSAKIRLDNGEATVFATGVYIDGVGKEQRIRLGGANSIAAEAMAKNKELLDQKLKAVEEAKLQLQKSVEALQTQQQAMLESRLPTIHTLQMQQAPYTLGVLLELKGEEGSEKDSEKQLVVTDVLPHSSAADAGLQPGDTIVKVDDTPVQSPEQLRQLVQAAGEADKSIELHWQRDGESKTATVTPKKNDRLMMSWGKAITSSPMPSHLGINPHEQIHRQLHEQVIKQHLNDANVEVKSEIGPDGNRVTVVAPKIATVQKAKKDDQADIQELKDEVRELRNELRALTEALKSR